MKQPKIIVILSFSLMLMLCSCDKVEQIEKDSETQLLDSMYDSETESVNFIAEDCGVLNGKDCSRATNCTLLSASSFWELNDGSPTVCSDLHDMWVCISDSDCENRVGFDPIIVKNINGKCYAIWSSCAPTGDQWIQDADSDCPTNPYLQGCDG